MEPQKPRKKRSAARWIIPLGILLVFAGLFVMSVVAVLGAAFSVEPMADDTTLVIRLSGGLKEAPDPFADVFPGLAGPASLFEIRQALLRAAYDDNIIAVKLDLGATQIGWAQARELRAAIDSFSATGKPVHAYLRGDSVNEVSYAVALAATKIWLAPESGFFVNGLRAEVEFWRGTLDKLHIEPQFIMMKEYKSAGEVYSRNEMSEHFREATLAVIEDIWLGFLDEVSARRGIDPEIVRTESDHGVLHPAEALASGWVDALGFDEDIRNELGEESGNGSWSGLGIRNYLEKTNGGDEGQAKIAVVFGEGVIVSGAQSSPFDNNFFGERVARSIREAANDDSVRAILLRVNSPGGSAVGSDYVWRAIEYARHERGTPVIVSMSSVAGSGGYWVAMASDAIVAQPNTITGSIGVVFGKFNVRGLYDLLGANVDTVQVGKNAHLMSFVSSLEGEQKERLVAWVETLYEDFKRKVAEGRSLELEAVEELARGRIWSGSDALELGLVDRLGGYEEAVEIARDIAGISPSEATNLVIYPKPLTFFELLFADQGFVHVAALLKTRSPEETLSATLREMTKPGAWVLAPTLHID